MSDRMSEAAQVAGMAMGEAVGVFMLHPQTLAGSVAAGYHNPLAGYVSGRGGVLGDATGTTVAAVFAVFEPAMVGALWNEGVAVRGAAGAARVYWEQVAEFGRAHLADVPGTARLAELAERVIAVTPTAATPMFAGWRAMPLAQDAAARAFQVMFVLRELRGDIHFNALSLTDITPVEAHMLHAGPDYTRMFGWPAPFADGADKRDRYDQVEDATNRRMAEIFAAALSEEEAGELASLSAAAREVLQPHAAG